ncbi:MAG: hypothetical protein H6R04_1048 [Burkholderiaceae bacterium]|nr:hypothetical protein [Burkholderiaceae bacterium]
MKNLALFIALASITIGFSQAVAQESPWLIRVRAVQIDTANKSDAFGGVPADRISVQRKAIPELDISYFFTKNIAAELILTHPQVHDVKVSGTKIGTFRHLPPVLTAQYHFSPDSKISPYVGAGINYTRIWDVNLGGLKLEQSSIGGALQAGVDFKLDKHWSINLDVKKVQIRSDVKNSDGSKLTSVKLDPWLIGVGVGYRF